MLLSHVPHIQVKIHSECFREQGAGEDIWAKKGGSNLGEGGGENYKVINLIISTPRQIQ
jgi:hypothetical protein